MIVNESNVFYNLVDGEIASNGVPTNDAFCDGLWTTPTGGRMKTWIEYDLNWMIVTYLASGV